MPLPATTLASPPTQHEPGKGEGTWETKKQPHQPPRQQTIICHENPFISSLVRRRPHFLCQLIEETASHREPKLSRTSTAKTQETPSACELLSSLSTSFTSKTQTSQTEFAQIPLIRLWMQGLQCSAVRRSRHSASLPITPGVYT